MRNERLKVINEADMYFSKYIRLRDSHDGVRGRCVTCGNTSDIKRMDCGHYIGRKASNTRWDEMNAFLQCKKCNNNGGQPNLMRIHIINTHGVEAVTALRLRSQQVVKTYSMAEQAIPIFKEKLWELTKKYDKTKDYADLF